ncbi:hypothetical protein SDC9_170814 [bioreactor metagenome]|uniref:Uncharacterized protein n=1 Tax=bioreactor metagenome TaxID=1076179 RepID=A0A645GBD4_9ZZZZ
MTVNLMDIPEWKVGIVFPERGLPDTFVTGATNIKNAAFNCSDKNLLLSWKIK